MAPRWARTRNNFSYSRAVSGTLADVREEVARTISVEALPVDLAIVALVSGRMDRIGGSTFSGLHATLLVVATIVLAFASSPSVVVARAVAVIEVWPWRVAGVTADMGTESLSGAGDSMWATTSNSENILALTPPEEASREGGRTCCPSADRACRCLQARTPSDHVCSRRLLTALPQFPNQEPPRPQQLVLPDLPMVPQSGHAGLTGSASGSGVGVEDESSEAKKEKKQPLRNRACMFRV